MGFISTRQIVSNTANSQVENTAVFQGGNIMPPISQQTQTNWSANLSPQKQVEELQKNRVEIKYKQVDLSRIINWLY